MATTKKAATVKNSAPVKRKPRKSLQKSAAVLKHIFDTTTSAHFNAPETVTQMSLQLDLKVWNDMGAPDHITVTIEPGATL